MGIKIEKASNIAGGSGEVTKKLLLSEGELNDKTRLYAEITLPPHSSIGYHVHHKESETYYILSGQGVYNDNGSERPVGAGDVTFTPDGCGHGLCNSGGTDLVFMALILLD